jgi:hypothetical protein
MLVSLKYSISVVSRFNTTEIQKKTIDFFQNFFSDKNQDIKINPEANTNSPSASVITSINEKENFSFYMYKNKITIVNEINDDVEGKENIDFLIFLNIIAKMQRELYLNYSINKVSIEGINVFTEISQSPNHYIAKSLLKEEIYTEDLRFCKITLGERKFTSPSEIPISARDTYFATRYNKSAAVAHAKEFIAQNLTEKNLDKLEEVIRCIEENFNIQSNSLRALKNA